MLPAESWNPLMKIQGVLFTMTDWSALATSQHPGASGSAGVRCAEAGNLRVRLVEYSPGYVADHWCARGHAALVLDGRLIIKLKDGRRFELGPGMSFQVGDDDGEHLALSPQGARVFIVD